MNLENGTSDPVDYAQSGGGPPQGEEVQDDQTGRLNPNGQSGDRTTFPASGTPPYSVTFVNANDKTQQATTQPFRDGTATVILNANWTITITT